jgi:hypothetical protein
LIVALSAKIESSEIADSYLSPKNDLTKVTVDIRARNNIASSFTMVITYLVTSPHPVNSSLTKTFTINFFDCKVASGTVNTLSTH